MLYMEMSMYLRRNSLERILLGLSFTKLERCSPMVEIDLEFPLPLSIQSRSLCGWEIKGYIIDTEHYLSEISNIYYSLVTSVHCRVT